jgi:hypothetical protein
VNGDDEYKLQDDAMLDDVYSDQFLQIELCGTKIKSKLVDSALGRI